MISNQTATDYWFTIEPYVYVGITNNDVLLYNILDGVTIESNKIEVLELVRETLQKENCGIVLLTEEQYQNTNINGFIRELRGKYMGEIIDITLSKGKPVQLLPFFNFSTKQEIYKNHNFSPFKNVLENLYEISIHIDHTTDIAKLIPFLQSVPKTLTFNLIGNMADITNYDALLSFFDQHPAPKYIVCSYTNVIALQPAFENNYSYSISVNFPMNMQQWNHSRQILLNQTLPIEYVFEVSSVDDCQLVEQIIEKFQIEKYHLYPIYTGDNIRFFEDNVFLAKEDILASALSLKDFFTHQAINIYDFGKINIMPNGDVYANLNYPVLGNIYMHNIHEIVYKEVEEGKSWFRVRNQAPCNDCVFQWLCPSPSNHEIYIGRPNLCHVKQL